MTTYIKAEHSNGGPSKDVGGAASGLVQSGARYRALAGLKVLVY